MIWNIRDNRERPYRWRNITAFVEPIWHDNHCDDSDQAEEFKSTFEVDYRENISLAEALDWAGNIPVPVTLFLYDLGKGTNLVKL